MRTSCILNNSDERDRRALRVSFKPYLFGFVLAPPSLCCIPLLKILLSSCPADEQQLRRLKDLCTGSCVLQALSVSSLPGCNSSTRSVVHYALGQFASRRTRDATFIPEDCVGGYINVICKMWLRNG